MKHLKYLSYIIRHKWFVMLACFRYGLIWQGIIHDWSKFLPSEWLPYVESFYGRGATLHKTKAWHELTGGRLRDESAADLRTIQDAFDAAWLKHQHRNPHHWQHWVLKEDSGAVKILEMPRRYMLEMLADWEGAGRAITGKKGGTPLWYSNNRHKIQLAPETRAFVDRALNYNSFTYSS